MGLDNIIKSVILSTAMVLSQTSAMGSETRTLDGYGNNIMNPTAGVSSIPFLDLQATYFQTYMRFDYSGLKPRDNAFLDGFQEPARPLSAGNLNTRQISNILSQQNEPTVEPI